MCCLLMRMTLLIVLRERSGRAHGSRRGRRSRRGRVAPRAKQFERPGRLRGPRRGLLEQSPIPRRANTMHYPRLVTLSALLALTASARADAGGPLSGGGIHDIGVPVGV